MKTRPTRKLTGSRTYHSRWPSDVPDLVATSGFPGQSQISGHVPDALAMSRLAFNSPIKLVLTNLRRRDFPFDDRVSERRPSNARVTLFQGPDGLPVQHRNTPGRPNIQKNVRGGHSKVWPVERQGFISFDRPSGYLNQP